MVKQKISLETIDDIAEHVAQFCDDYYEDVLCVFDIDQTLLKPADKIIADRYAPAYAEFLNALLAKLSLEQKDEMLNLAIAESGLTFMEPNTLKFVNDLKRNGAAVMALTASLVGKVGKCPHFEMFRYQTFVEAGLRFSEHMTVEERVELTNLASFRHYYPVFYRGVLFGNGVRSPNSKGVLLVEFLKKCRIQLQKIIFIDDIKTHVDAVWKIFNPTDLDILAIEYTQYQNMLPSSTHMKEFQKKWMDLFNQIIHP